MASKAYKNFGEQFDDLGSSLIANFAKKLSMILDIENCLYFNQDILRAAGT